MPDITNEKSYEKVFSKKIPADVKWREEALKYALDLRKFEIDLYWKRQSFLIHNRNRVDPATPDPATPHVERAVRFVDIAQVT